MNILKAENIILELIEISDIKYSYLKVGRDTLNYDILFIEKYEQLKEMLGATTLEDVDTKRFPNIKKLREIVKEINDFETAKQNKHVRMTKAVKAYKK